MHLIKHQECTDNLAFKTLSLAFEAFVYSLNRFLGFSRLLTSNLTLFSSLCSLLLSLILFRGFFSTGSNIISVQHVIHLISTYRASSTAAFALSVASISSRRCFTIAVTLVLTVLKTSSCESRRFATLTRQDRITLVLIGSRRASK